MYLTRWTMISGSVRWWDTDHTVKTSPPREHWMSTYILGNGELLLQSLGNAADNPKGCWSDLHKQWRCLLTNSTRTLQTARHYVNNGVCQNGGALMRCPHACSLARRCPMSGEDMFGCVWEFRISLRAMTPWSEIESHQNFCFIFIGVFFKQHTIHHGWHSGARDI